MALSSLRNQPCYIKKELQQSTDVGKYMLATPGPGANVGFAEDPHLRLQKWGANLRTNTINCESDLMGLSRSLTKDCTPLNEYNSFKCNSEAKNYGTITANTEESRAIMPAWTVLDQENNRKDYLHFNPQKEQMLFQGQSSRIESINNYNSCFVKKY